MAYIITSKTRKYATLKPPLGSQLNYSHPLSQGLVGCWLMNEGGGKILTDLSRDNGITWPTTSAFWTQQFGSCLRYDDPGGNTPISFSKNPIAIMKELEENYVMKGVGNPSSTLGEM